MTKLQQLRTSKNLSQQQLADLAGVNVRVLQHYEQGSRRVDYARMDTIMKLAKALDCKMVEIIEDPEFLKLIDEVNLK